VSGGQPLPSRLVRPVAGLNVLTGTRRIFARHTIKPAGTLVVLTSVLVASALGLSACGNTGLGEAQQACGHIDKSIAALQTSEHTSDPATRAQLQQEAYRQLRAALPIASEAAFHDGTYQALMTTVSESNRVAESLLVPALQAQCAETVSGPLGAPFQPSNTSPVITSPVITSPPSTSDRSGALAGGSTTTSRP